ncbi:hypothetical protein H0H87_012334 [Tephrocybe sp. NHM501043]|nr:hypothetical protein H0H87_012334 [Tephrocybe sp. NHM501043]
MFSHGSTIGYSHIFEAGDNEYFAGIFGAVDADPDKPILPCTGFLVYNKVTGSIDRDDPVPNDLPLD